MPGVWRPYSLAGAPRRDDLLEQLPFVLGYGGVLSRVDSLLITFPLSYYALILVDKVVR